MVALSVISTRRLLEVSRTTFRRCTDTVPGAAPCAAANDASNSRIPNCLLAHIFQASLYCLIQFPFGLPGTSVAMALVAIRTAIYIAVYAAMVRVGLGLAMAIGA